MKDIGKVDELIYQQMIQNASLQELDEINSWVSESKENLDLYNRIREPERIKKSFHIYDQLDVDIAFQKIIPKKEKVIALIPNWLKYAVAATVLIVSGLFYVKFSSREIVPITQSQITRQSTKGHKSQIKLPDGTHVWLNAASSISYDQGFNANERLVMLQGEAYFEVIEDNTRPFRVASGDVMTTALGTSFNVKAHKGENIKVSLNSGKVKVTRMDNHKYVILQPGQRAELSDAGLSVSKFDNETDFGWKDGTIYFDNTGFNEMIRVLENWYDVSFVIENLPLEKRKALKVSGKFKNQTISNVLKLISHSLNFDYHIKKKVVTIKFKDNQ